MCTTHYGRWMKYGTTEQRYRHCPKNHTLSPDNVVEINGQRRCHSCQERKPDAEPCIINGCESPQLARSFRPKPGSPAGDERDLAIQLHD